MLSERIIAHFDDIENLALEFATRLGPWLAPIGPAYFVGRSVYHNLNAHWVIAVVMAIAIECVGIAASHCALRCWTWNQTKRKSDPEAPFILMVWLSLVYFGAAFSLAILTEVIQELATYAPAVFLGLAAVAYVTIGVAMKLHTWEDERKVISEARQVKGQLTNEVKQLAAQVDQKRRQLTTLQTNLNRQRVEVDAQIDGQFEGKATNPGSFGPHNLDKANQAREVKIARRRERVLTLKRQNHTLQHIADTLEVSLSTVKNDLKALNGKLEEGH